MASLHNSIVKNKKLGYVQLRLDSLEDTCFIETKSGSFYRHLLFSTYV